MRYFIIIPHLHQFCSNLSTSLSYHSIVPCVRTVRYVQCVHLNSEQCSGHGRRRRSKPGKCVCVCLSVCVSVCVCVCVCV
jgi:hypothetical protein